MDNSTKEFENRIELAKSIDDLRTILNDLPKVSFKGRFLELADHYNMTLSQVQSASGIAKASFYAFFNPDKTQKRNPQKYHIVRIGLAMGASVEEINELLKLAGHKELYAKNREDAIVIFSIRNHLKITELYEFLDAEGIQTKLMDK